MSNSFCSAPWGSLFYHTTSARVCCVSDVPMHNISPIDFLKSDFVKQLRSDFLDGKQPDSCKGCWNLENRGLTSIRPMVNEISGNLDPATLSVEDEYPISYLELRDGNLCNMGCRMCGPEASSIIQTEYENNSAFKQIYGPGPFIKNKDKMSDVVWEEIRQLAPGYRHINITGGEPMLQKRILDFLQFMLDSGNHKNTRLHICTNTSVINPYIIELFTKLDKVLLTMSIDGIGSTAEYQRYGTKWDQVSANIEKYIQLPYTVDKSIVSTVTAYSILDYYNFAKYLVEIYNKTPWNLISFFPRADSWSFNPDVLIGELKYRALDEINKSIDLFIGTETKNNNFKTTIDELGKIKNLLESKEDNLENYAKFISNTKILDETRNQSFESVFGYKLY